MRDSRLAVLRHVAAINAYGDGWGARMPYGELVEEANAAIADGQMIWRDDVPFPGRFLTEAGRRVIAGAPPEDEA